MKQLKSLKLWWAILGIPVLLFHSLSGCGKNTSGGPQVTGPGLSGYSNNCGVFGCIGGAAGQQLTKVSGALTYDDELDSSESKSQKRLMQLDLNVNMWQNYGYNSALAPNYLFTSQVLRLSGPVITLSYSGPVHVSGTLQVVAPIIGCNIPQGHFQLQAQSVGILSFGQLTVPLGANINGGQGFTLMLEGINLIPSNWVVAANGPIGSPVVAPNGGLGAPVVSSNGGVGSPTNPGNAETRLVGVVRIPTCGNATFKVE